MNRTSGIFKSYSINTHYSFIKGDHGKDYFLHSSSLETDDVKNLFDGIRVVIDVKPGYKGPVATNVQIKESEVI